MQVYKEYKEGDELAKVLAVLLYVQGGYTYVDKISQAASKDLALYYAREALRDYNSLLTSGKISDPEANNLSNKINFDRVENELGLMRSIDSVPTLRELVSYISASALALAAKMKTSGEYRIAVSALNYLNSKGIKPSDADALSKKLNDKKDEISKELNVDVEVIESISQNKSLLSYLISKDNEKKGEQ
jgi:CRISPR-associated protein Csa5